MHEARARAEREEEQEKGSKVRAGKERYLSRGKMNRKRVRGRAEKKVTGT